MYSENIILKKMDKNICKKINFTNDYFYIIFTPTKTYLKMAGEKVVRINRKTANIITNN